MAVIHTSNWAAGVLYTRENSNIVDYPALFSSPHSHIKSNHREKVGIFVYEVFQRANVISNKSRKFQRNSFTIIQISEVSKFIAFFNFFRIRQVTGTDLEIGFDQDSPIIYDD